MRILIITIILLTSLQAIFAQDKNVAIEDGYGLVKEMHRKYSHCWYQHLTFKQDMFRYRDDSLVRNEVWVVAYSAPAKLHIRYLDFDSGRGWLIVNDTIHSFNHNKLIGKRPRLHELMTIGLDAYIDSPENTIKKLGEMKLDLSKLCVATVNGKVVYQVGDPNQVCFWVHKDDLLFYGLRHTGEFGVRETFFENYKTFYSKPIATEVHYFQDGKMYLFERYFEIRLPSSLPESFFEPDQFTQTRW